VAETFRRRGMGASRIHQWQAGL